MNSERYWQAIDALVSSCEIMLDRPKGSCHPRYPAMVYPLDYGYLTGTHAADGNEIDCWVGSLPDRQVTAVVFTVDMVKQDIEGKLLLGCTQEEMQRITDFHNNGPQSALLVVRPQQEIG